MLQTPNTMPGRVGTHRITMCSISQNGRKGVWIVTASPPDMNAPSTPTQCSNASNRQFRSTSYSPLPEHSPPESAGADLQPCHGDSALLGAGGGLLPASLSVSVPVFLLLRLLPASRPLRVLLRLRARPRIPFLDSSPSCSPSSLEVSELCSCLEPEVPVSASSASSSSCGTKRLALRLGRLFRADTLCAVGLSICFRSASAITALTVEERGDGEYRDPWKWWE